MEPPKPLDPGAKIKTFPLPNGALKKINHPRSSPPPAAADSLYRECLKNHAATLGGHAVDGCGEFMPSPAFNPADPTSLTCAACGCHRNFHRRIPLPLPTSDEIDGHDDSLDDDEAHRSSSSPPPYFSSAPHMLLALSAGLSPAGPTAGPAPAAAAAAAEVGPPVVPARKRFRTRFSPEQKGRMQELSEKLGWRMQKRDEGLVEEWCREIGVGKGVFKVWMHNNKHSYLGGGRRGGDGNGGGAEIQGKGGGEGGEGGGEGVGGGSVVEGSSLVVNGSSSSS